MSDDPRFLFPMRPSVPKMLPPTPHEFLIQTKYDGWNVVVAGGRVWTRHGNEITDWCADWGFDLAPPRPIHGELLAVADGEVVARADIQGIRSGRCRPRVVAFDLMVEGPPLEDRLQELSAWLGEATPAVTRLDDWARLVNAPLPPAGSIVLAPTADSGLDGSTWADVNRRFDEALARGREGLMLKRKGSPYHTSHEVSIVTDDWLKVKVGVG